MIRHSGWRKRERSWGESILSSPITIVLAASTFLYGGLIMFLGDAPDFLGSFVQAAVALGLTPIVLWGARRRSLAVVRLVDGDPDEVPVTVTLRLPEVDTEIGSDEGLLCLESGWLVFRGMRTEWSVRTTDVSSALPATGFRFPDADKGTRLATLVSYDRIGQTRVRELLVRWACEPPPHGEPVFPPAHATPETRGVRSLRSRSIMVVLSIAAAVFVYNGGYPDAFWPAFVIAFLLTLELITAWCAKGRLRAYHALPPPPAEPSLETFGPEHGAR